MKHFKTMTALLVATLPLLNCSHKPKFDPVKNNVYEELQAKKRKLGDKGVLAEVAISESKNLQTGINKVELEARARLSRTVESKTSSLQKKFQEEVGREFADHFSQAVKSISDQTLRGTTMVETRFEKNEDGMYRVYGLMILDAELYMKAMSGELEADKSNRDRWRASRAYKDLNDEVAAYREWKKQEAAPNSAQAF